MDADGRNQRLTDIPGRQAWSPDGQSIAFTSDRNVNDEIYVMDADGNNERNLTNNPAAHDWKPRWSPDGQRIAFNSDRDGNYEIYVMDADGSNQRRLTNNPAMDSVSDWFDPVFASVSPAGKLKGIWGEIRRGR
jgi:TolB protein